MAELIDRKEIFFTYERTDNEDYNKGFDDGVLYALDKIDEMPTANEWISVKERLPKQDEDVLVCCAGGFMNVYTYMGDDIWEDDYGYFGTTEAEYITHWMPLPKSPKGE